MVSIVSAALLAMTSAAVPAASVVVTPADASARTAPSGAGGPVDPVRTGTTVTLVTGDRIRIATTSDGYVASPVPGPNEPASGGAGGLLMRQIEGRSYVIPVRAAGMLAAGTLDMRLFDLETLAEARLGDADTAELPLLLELPENRPMSTSVETLAAPGLRVGDELDLVDAVTVEQERVTAEDSWEVLASAVSDGSVEKIWLDGGVRAQMDRSAGQVGAPELWSAGVTGAGIRVAVLDTGYDPTHPDLADQVVEARNFVDDEPPVDGPGGAIAGDTVPGEPAEVDPDDVVDHNGHGTHVAGTIAGSGAASGGTYTGIAPEADLLVGRVCDASGFCEMSAIIAGMAWAAERADVVNLSLGGGPSDGTDPMSDALNQLAAEHDTVFVVAAGNDGDQGPGWVSAPAVADAALAVGSVSKADGLSAFSSRGPRFGDSAIKPEIVAPGERIASARADGTLAASAIGDDYAELSGTSMATPHVAGAAALLAQSHPEWSGDRIRSALIGGAVPLTDLSVFERGAGRLDVAASAELPVTAEPAVLGFGLVEWPHADAEPIERAVTFHNDGDRPVRLDLELTTSDADPIPSEMLELETSTVTVPAGGAASVTVTLRPVAADGTAGSVSGRLEAVAPDGGVIGVPVGADVEPSSHTQTFTILDRTGNPVGEDEFGSPLGLLALINPDTGEWDVYAPTDGEVRVRIPDGRWLVDAYAVEADGSAITAMIDPGREFDRDGVVVLDARQGERLRVGPAPREDASVVYSIGARREVTDWPSGWYATGYSHFGPLEDPDVYAVRAAGEPDEFLGFMNAIWAAASDGESGGTLFEDSPYTYHQVEVWPGEIPADLDIPLDSDRLVRVDARYPKSADTDRWAWTFPDPRFRLDRHRSVSVWAFMPAIGMRLPFEREEYFSTADGIEWGEDYEVYLDEHYWEVDTDHEAAPVTHRSGEASERTWLGGVLGPALPPPSPGGWQPFGGLEWAARDGDTIRFVLPLFADPDPGRVGLTAVETQRTRLYRDGEPIGDSDSPLTQTFRVPESTGRYRLTTEATRPGDTGNSTAVHAEWTFRSARTPDGRSTPLPLLSVQFAPNLDLNGRSPAGRRIELPITVQRSVDGPALVGRLTVEASFDEGRTWRRLPVRRTGLETWTARVANPDTGSVSLRATAEDLRGETVTQTIERAYRVR